MTPSLAKRHSAISNFRASATIMIFATRPFAPITRARNRMDNGPHNLAVLRHMALNVMRKEESKTSLRGKFKKAAWNEDYLVKLLALF